MSETKENPQSQFLKYEEEGFSYQKMDAYKLEAQFFAQLTSPNLEKVGFKLLAETRGESATVFDVGPFYLAIAHEDLGTKNMVAEDLRKITGFTYMENVATSVLAAMTNDVCAVGAKPFGVTQHLAAGDERWFADDKAARDYIAGWFKTCNDLEITWLSGETAIHLGQIYPDRAILTGACLGKIDPRENFILAKNLSDGDRILLLPSNGLQENAYTLARRLAEKLPFSYAARLPSGRMYGEALLDPSFLYAPLVQNLQNEGVKIHYASNITGHGWRKIMRADRDFSYVIEEVPQLPEVFEFMMKNGPVDLREAYASMNMGAGFALFVSEADVLKAQQIGQIHGMEVLDAGHVKTGPRRVIIKPLSVIFEEEDFKIR